MMLCIKPSEDEVKEEKPVTSKVKAAEGEEQEKEKEDVTQV